MAERFCQHEIPSIALTADSPKDVRDSAQNQLKNGEIKEDLPISGQEEFERVKKHMMKELTE